MHRASHVAGVATTSAGEHGINAYTDGGRGRGNALIFPLIQHTLTGCSAREDPVSPQIDKWPRSMETPRKGSISQGTTLFQC